MRSLNAYLPEFDFWEWRETAIRATPERVCRESKAVSLAEIPVARGLAWFRRLGRRGSAPHTPFPETALRGPPC